MDWLASDAEAEICPGEANRTIVVTQRTCVKVLRKDNRTLSYFTAIGSIVEGCQHALSEGSISAG